MYPYIEYEVQTKSIAYQPWNLGNVGCHTPIIKTKSVPRVHERGEEGCGVDIYTSWEAEDKVREEKWFQFKQRGENKEKRTKLRLIYRCSPLKCKYIWWALI